jgi:hypothetical protein
VAKPQYQTRFRALCLRLTVYPYYLPFITILENTLQNVWKVYKTCAIFVETIKITTMANRLKTQQDKLNEHYAAMQKQYAKESLGMGWFFAIITVALLLTALIENL